jgi:hypothetical protein
MTDRCICRMGTPIFTEGTAEPVCAGRSAFRAVQGWSREQLGSPDRGLFEDLTESGTLRVLGGRANAFDGRSKYRIP